MESTMQRFELRENDRLFGLVDYYRFDRIVIVTHTETHPALPGKGNGNRLAAEAIAWFASQGWQVVPICSFMAHFLRTHPQYHDTVSPESRRLFRIGTPS